MNCKLKESNSILIDNDFLNRLNYCLHYCLPSECLSLQHVQETYAFNPGDNDYLFATDAKHFAQINFLSTLIRQEKSFPVFCLAF